MILFLTEEPYNFNLNGAAALSSSHLRFLAKRFPDRPIHVLFFNKNKNYWNEPPDFKNQNITISYVRPLGFHFRPLNWQCFSWFLSSDYRKLIPQVFNIELLREPIPEKLKDAQQNPGGKTLIWCEHLMPILYLYLIYPENLFKKVVYSHHDFLFKILGKRAHSPQKFIRSLLVKKLELSVLKKINSFFSGSQFELDQIKALAPQARHFEFLPCFYPPESSNSTFTASGDVKIYHLGTASATANRIGLRFFFQKVFPAIAHLPFTLEFFGNVQDYILEEFPTVKNHPKIIFHGFVLNLNDKIAKNMIHIIPYSGMTGTRTRVAGLTRFKPCLLGFKTIQDSYPCILSGENALLASTEEDFTEKLKTLILNKRLRLQLSENIIPAMSNLETRLQKKPNLKNF